MVERNGRTYLWTNDKIKGYSYISELTLNPGNHLLLKLPKLVEVTPETVAQKLSFYMVFI
jgi:hypothetical protein